MLNSPADDPLVHPLVARVEAARVAAHARPGRSRFCTAATACASAQLSASGISTCTCLPAFRHGDRLRGVHLRRRAQDHRVDVLRAPGFGEVGAWHAPMPYLRGDLLGLLELAADQRDDLDAVDDLEAVEVLDAERAGAGERDA